MIDLWMAAITNMSGPFAVAFVAVVGGITIMFCVARTSRADVSALRAREEVRSRELNQINNALFSLQRRLPE